MRNYLEEYMKLTDSAHKARELSEQLSTKIDSTIVKLNNFLNEDTTRPAIVENYQPIDFERW